MSIDDMGRHGGVVLTAPPWCGRQVTDSHWCALETLHRVIEFIMPTLVVLVQDVWSCLHVYKLSQALKGQ